MAGIEEKRKRLYDNIGIVIFLVLFIMACLIVVILAISREISTKNKKSILGEVAVDYEKYVTEYSNGDKVYNPSEENLAYDEESSIIYYDNLLIVYLLEELSINEIEKLEDSVNGVVVGTICGSVNVIQIMIPSSDLTELKGYANILMECEEVLYVSYDIPMCFSEEDNNPWSEDGIEIDDKGKVRSPDGNDWWAEAIDAYSAWNFVDRYSSLFNNVTVGILDNGFDTDHPELKNITVINDNSAADHGTHVAGIIGAANNTEGIRGISENLTIVCADWSKEIKEENGEVDTENLLSTGEWIELTKQLIESGARVVNNSWGAVLLSANGYAQELYDSSGMDSFFEACVLKWTGTYESYLKYRDAYSKRTAFQCILLIVELGMNSNQDFLFVQSAGNGYDNNGNGYDAVNSSHYSSVSEDNYNLLSETVRQKFEELGFSYSKIKEHILIVGAVENLTQKGTGYYKMASFSNYGEVVDICAPGVGVYSTLTILDDDTNEENAGQEYGELSGTSMSAPMVSGAAALIWSINPELSAAEVKKILCENISTYAVGIGDDEGSLYPMLNVGLAVDEVGSIYAEEIVLLDELDGMVTNYGVFITTQSTWVWNTRTEWIGATGVLSATILDYDSDGDLEMLLCIPEEIEYGGEKIEVIALLMYEVEDGIAVMQDIMRFLPYGMEDEMTLFAIDYACCNNASAIMNTLRIDGDYYMVCELYEEFIFGDGAYEAYWILEYTGSEFQYVSCYSQDSPGSSECSYIGNEFERGWLISSDIYYGYDGDNSIGLFANNIEALGEFFGKYGIICKAYGNYETHRNEETLELNLESILLGGDECINNFEFINLVSDSSSSVDYELGGYFTANVRRGNDLLDAY